MALYDAPSITILGRTTKPVEFDQRPDNAVSATVSVAVNTRAYSKQANGRMPYGDTHYYRTKLFGEDAERAVRQLNQKGISVLVHGDVYHNEFTPKGAPENFKATSHEIRNATIAVTLDRYQEIAVTRQESNNQQYNNAQPAPQQTQGNNGWQNQAQPQYNQQAPQYGQPQPQYNTGDWNAAPAGDETPPF